MFTRAGLLPSVAHSSAETWDDGSAKHGWVLWYLCTCTKWLGILSIWIVIICAWVSIFLLFLQQGFWNIHLPKINRRNLIFTSILSRVSAQSSPGSPLFHSLFTVSVGATGLCPQWPHNLLVWQTEQLSLLGGGLSVSHLAFFTFITFIIIPGLARKSQWTNEKELQKNWKMYRDKLMSQYCTARCLGIKSIVLNINWKYLKQSKNIWWHSRFSSLFYENIESMNWMNTYVRINSVKRLLRKIFPILNCFEK